MDEWKESVWIMVSVSISAIVLLFAVNLGSIGNQLAAQQQTENNSIAVIQDYREWSQYDNTQLYPQDIISFILQYRGTPTAMVDTGAGSGAQADYSLVWSNSSAPCNYTDVDISNLLPVGASYTSTLIKNGNGAVTAVEFRRN